MCKTIFSTIFIFLLVITIKLNAQNNHKAKIDSLINVCHHRGIFNGNVLIIKNNKTLYRIEKGYTDGKKNKKLNRNALFDIGSIAKEFNSVGIMMLKEKGLLSLDDKVSKYLLGLPDWSDKVSIRHLLQYSSGLPLIDWDKVKNDDDIYENLKNLSALDFEVGSGYLYSNNNIFLQRRIIEKISGLTFNQFIEQKILQPIGMNNTVIDHQYQNPNFVRGFNNSNINDDEQELKMSGWICPSIDDLSKWTKYLLSYQLISKESLYILFDKYMEEGESALGQGMFQNEALALYEHHGSSLSYESLVRYDLKQDLIIILMTNNKSLKIVEIVDAISHILKDEPYEVPQKSIYLTIREKTYTNVDEGIKQYKILKKNSPDVYNFSNQWELARLSYKLFERDQNIDAIKILKLLTSELPTKSEETLAYLGSRILSENHVDKSILIYELMVTKFPSGKSYSSLGDAYYKNKQQEIALENYKKSLEMDPDNDKSKNMILKIEK
ncbi:serine hydrolase [Aquimarina addita]